MNPFALLRGQTLPVQELLHHAVAVKISSHFVNVVRPQIRAKKTTFYSRSEVKIFTYMDS